ncbi:MAG: hypothetical protein ACRC7O_19170 [Fimbriiglobus sp.]
MPYSQFDLSAVIDRFGLKVNTSADIFGRVPPVPLRPNALEVLEQNKPLALLMHTEKARAELLIAPILAELWFQSGRTLTVYSGTELNVDPERSLTGVCDFMVGKPPHLVPVRPPILVVVEAKKEDIPAGYGQCAAAMVGALELNARETNGLATVYGCVTTGVEWRFLRLTGAALDIEMRDYLISEPDRILGVLFAVTGAAPVAA